MRKHLLLSVFAALAICGASASTVKVDELGAKYSSSLTTAATGAKAPSRVTAEEILACPEGSVFAGEFHDDGGYSGFQSSDQARPGLPTKYYQHISDNYYVVNGARFYGLFNYFDEEAYSWTYCNDRAGIDEDGVMTTPIKFEISLYQEAADGLPGEQIYTKVVDLIGTQTGVVMGDDSSGYQDLYAFEVDFGQDIKLETGYFSVSAVDMGDSPTCWFSLFTASSSVDYAYIQMGDSFQFASLPMIFCLKGDGTMAAEKSLKVARLLAPAGSVDGKFEHVQIELKNAGSKAIADGRFELWADGKYMTTEDIDVEIPSLGLYKYNFTARIDCSKPGTHNFELRNVTPGDEKLCADKFSFEVVTATPGEVEPSESEVCDYNSISCVWLGDNENRSGATNYSDFTDIAATIRPGETVNLKIEPTSRYAYLAAWIDWNGNGVLGEKDEAVYILNDFTAEITIPAGVQLSEGDKLLRIITSYDIPVPAGTYSMGETEDYTITVARHAGAPAVTNDIKDITEFLKGDSRTVSLNIGNAAQGQLQGQLDIHYILPNTPAAKFSSNDQVDNAPVSVVSRKISGKSRMAAPAANAQTGYTIRYDNGQYQTIGITNSEQPIYANLYPGKMLEALKGMTLTSVDIYIGEASQKSKVLIYGAKSQSENGDLILEQEFNAVSDSWNRIVLSKPVAIDGTDLWICLQVEGFEADSYHIGVDFGPATRGFGDIINIGGSIWWSMADLAYDYNYCIRGNVTGNATPAISWLSVDKNAIDIASGSTSEHKITLDGSALNDNSLYEAVVEIVTNDALTPKVTLPVYLVNGHFSGIEAVEATDTKVIANGGVVAVEASKEVASLKLYNLAGVLAASANGSVLEAGNIATGAYILVVSYADGTEESFKLLYSL